MKFITNPFDTPDAFAGKLTQVIADPGAFVPRIRHSETDYEPLHVWQARAVISMFQPIEASDGSAQPASGVSEMRDLFNAAKGVTPDQLELQLARGHLREAARAFEALRAENNQLRNFLRVAGDLLGRADADPIKLAQKVELGIITVNDELNKCRDAYRAEREQVVELQTKADSDKAELERYAARYEGERQANSELNAVQDKACRVIAGNADIENSGSLLDMLNVLIERFNEVTRTSIAEREELGRLNSAIACGRTRPGVGIGAIIWKGDKFLMVRRTTEHGQGTWSVPGGWQEYSESFEQAAQREAEEETGVTCEPNCIAGVTNNVFDSEGMHSITVFVHCRYSGGEPFNREAHKHSEVRWVEPRDLPAPLFLPVQLLLRHKPTALLAHSAF